MTDEELKRLLAENSAELRAHVDSVAAALGRQFDTATAESRGHYRVGLEHADGRFDLLAESISQVSESLDRTRKVLEDDIERTAADTQAMVKFSHAELDRRVRTLEESHRSLEETVASLASRVERIESSAH